jgi:tetratricopeptide (TPR) repeat protein
MKVADILELWDFGDPAASEARFREVLQDGWDAEVTTQIARAQGLQGEFAKARETLEEVRDRIDQSPSPELARFLLESGRVENSSGNTEGSATFFKDALAVANSIGNEYLAIDAAHMLGIVGNGEAALEWNKRAIEMALRAKNEQARQWLGSLHNNLGWALHDLGKYEEALIEFTKALEFRGKQGKPDNIRIAKWCIGRCLRSLGRLDEALDIQRGLYEELENDGYILEEIGENLLALGEPEEAAIWFGRAAEKLRGAVDDERLARMIELSGN